MPDDPYAAYWALLEAHGVTREAFQLDFFATGIVHSRPEDRVGAKLTYTPTGWIVKNNGGRTREANVKVVMTVMAALLSLGDAVAVDGGFIVKTEIDLRYAPRD